MKSEELTFREGAPADLEATFGLSERAVHDVAARNGVLDATPPSEADIRRRWQRQRPLVEFMAGQPGGSYHICEEDERAVGYARVVRFDGFEELTELMIDPEHQGRGIGRALLDRAWPLGERPTIGRVVVATGAPADLSLYTSFGVMPVAGHWHMRQRTDDYLERRSREIDAAEPAVHVLEADRAVTEWRRLEPMALGLERPSVHEHFGRERTCLADVDEDTGRARGLCWVSGDGEIGPAVGERPQDVVPVVLAALDRVAMTQEPPQLGVFASTIAWWLLARLRGLGFRVHWPGWVMSSEPIPGLDRYLPTRPPNLL